MNVEEALKNDYILIDVRSPGEYEESAIPGAINIPVLDDEERVLIGTLYKQSGSREARRKGIEIVSSKLTGIYDAVEREELKGKELVMYCARGGMRSRSLVELLASIGHRVHQLEGGYKAYRRYILDNLDSLINSKKVVVIHGNTGAGKTELLKLLRGKGFPSVDLEYMANSRGSIFGTVGLGKPRSQKVFEGLLFNRLREIREGYIIVESESPRVGKVYLPKALVKRMREGIHILVEASVEERVDRIVKEYVEIQDEKKVVGEIQEAIERLEGELGRRKTETLLELLRTRDYREITRILLMDHYDAKYHHSEKRYDYSLVLSSRDIQQCAREIEVFLERTFQ